MTNNFTRLGRLIRKELSEILRDRRTIITLVLMPLLLYPLLSVAFQQFFLASGLATGTVVKYRFGFVADEDYERFSARIQLGERILMERQAAAKNNGKNEEAPAVRADAERDTFENLEKSLRAGVIDAILRHVRPPESKAPPAGAPADDPFVEFEVLYLPTAAGTQGMLMYLEQRLAAANEMDLAQAFKIAGLRSRTGIIQLSRTPLENARGGSMMSLASLVPLILILMTITGAVYPAIDLTAGERERGTLEILVAAPVPRLGLLFAKYVSVVTVAVLTALVNLVAMTSTLLLSGLGPALFAGQGFSLGTIVQLFGLLLLFALFFSAVLLCITSFARSFKEAQAYLIPLMLASLGPGVMGMMPGLELADWAAAPLVNIVLLGRDLLKNEAALAPTLVVIVTTLGYAAAAISVAARVFGAEGVLFNEQSGWGDLFRRPTEAQPFARVSAVLWCLALMIPLNFILQGTALHLVQAGILESREQLFVGPVHAILLFGALPALFAWRGHLQMTSAFAFKAPTWTALFGGVVLGLSIWPVLLAAMALLGQETLRGRHHELYEQIIESFSRLSPYTKVALVVIPAVLEEWFFRGYLYGAVRQRAGAAATIAITAALFGLTHFVLRPEMGLVRLLPSAVMGLVLGAVRESSGSVWPSMFLHACHNAFLILLVGEREDAAATLEAWWVMAGAVGCATGAALTWLGRVSTVVHPR